MRAATAAAHQRLEDVMALDTDRLTRARYAAALQVLHAMRAGWDPGLAALFGQPPGPHAQWLAQDLAALGVSSLPPLAMPAMDAAEGWGMRYVLEGSALGGRVLLRRAEWMGLSPDAGARYFAGEGAETGPRWKRFLQALDQAATPEAVPLIVQGARRSFEALAEAAEARFASARFHESLDARQDLAAPLAAVEDAVMADPRL
ncbi:MAG: biliverdin-producing heme oxygenase [Janthinobacterium lividum]